MLNKVPYENIYVLKSRRVASLVNHVTSNTKNKQNKKVKQKIAANRKIGM